MTTDQRLNHANERIAKLAGEIEVLRRVVAAQNEATAALRHEWRLWSHELLRTVPATDGVNASKMLAGLMPSST